MKDCGAINTYSEGGMPNGPYPAVAVQAEPVIVLLNHIEDVISDEEWNKIDPSLWNAVTRPLSAAHPKPAAPVTAERDAIEGDGWDAAYPNPAYVAPPDVVSDAEIDAVNLRMWSTCPLDLEQGRMFARAILALRSGASALPADTEIAQAVRPLYASDEAAAMGLADDIRTAEAVLAMRPARLSDGAIDALASNYAHSWYQPNGVAGSWMFSQEKFREAVRAALALR